MEITIKTDSEKEFREVIDFLKKEKITVVKSTVEYSKVKNFVDFKVMEGEMKKYRIKLPVDFKFNREEANER